MMKYVDICVDMKAGRKCKDALINYRNACQQVNVGSLEDVVKYLLQVASARAEEASKAAEAKLDGVEDLEAEASPEEMMLSYVSGEKSKDRTDRELVTPWFKFLWETYRCARLAALADAGVLVTVLLGLSRSWGAELAAASTAAVAGSRAAAGQRRLCAGCGRRSSGAGARPQLWSRLCRQQIGCCWWPTRCRPAVAVLLLRRPCRRRGRRLAPPA